MLQKQLSFGNEGSRKHKFVILKFSKYLIHSVTEKLITIYDPDEKIWHSVWSHQHTGQSYYISIGNMKKRKIPKMSSKIYPKATTS